MNNNKIFGDCCIACPNCGVKLVPSLQIAAPPPPPPYFFADSRSNQSSKDYVKEEAKVYK